MRRIELDFVRTTGTSRTGAALFAAGVLLVGLLGHALGEARDRAAAAEATAARAARADRAAAPAPPALTPAGAESLKVELRQAAAAMERLTVPWPALFAEIEDAQSDAIALLAIQPDPRNRLVRISGEARDAETLAAYIKRLEAGAALHRVHLAAHEFRNESGQVFLRFALVANWSEPRS